MTRFPLLKGESGRRERETKGQRERVCVLQRETHTEGESDRVTDRMYSIRPVLGSSRGLKLATPLFYMSGQLSHTN